MFYTALVQIIQRSPHIGLEEQEAVCVETAREQEEDSVGGEGERGNLMK